MRKLLILLFGGLVMIAGYFEVKRFLPRSKIILMSERTDYRLVLKKEREFIRLIDSLGLSFKRLDDNLKTDGRVKNFRIVLASQQQAHYQISDKNGVIFQSAMVDYESNSRDLVIKVYYSDKVLDELMRNKSQRIDYDILIDLCIVSDRYFRVEAVDKCGGVIRDSLDKERVEPIFVLVKNIKSGWFWPRVVKPIYAQAVCGGRFECCEAKSVCTCSDPLASCSIRGVSCGTGGTCSCVTMMLPEPGTGGECYAAGSDCIPSYCGTGAFVMCNVGCIWLPSGAPTPTPIGGGGGRACGNCSAASCQGKDIEAACGGGGEQCQQTGGGTDICGNGSPKCACSGCSRKGDFQEAVCYNLSGWAKSSSDKVSMSVDGHYIGELSANGVGDVAHCGCDCATNPSCHENCCNNVWSYSFFPPNNMVYYYDEGVQRPINLTDGGSHQIKIETCDDLSNSPREISCLPATCTIQGFKVLMPGNQNTAPAAEQAVTLDGGQTSTNNMYSFDTTPGSHTVSVTVPAGYSAGYTVCTDTYDCHTVPPATITAGNSVDIFCPLGSRVDLWWHFDPPKTCSVSVGPSSSLVSQGTKVNLSGNAYSANSHTIQLKVAKTDGSKMAAGVKYNLGGGEKSAVEVESNGWWFYQLADAQCDSANYSDCSTSNIGVTMPQAGDYYFFCQSDQDPRMCSGSPFCSYETETVVVPAKIDCSPAVSCSGSDNASYKATEVPSPPMNPVLVLKNEGGGVITPEAGSPGGSGNQICDEAVNNITQKRVSFVVSAEDAGGGETIDLIEVHLGGLVVGGHDLATAPLGYKNSPQVNFFKDISTSVDGITRTIEIPVEFSDGSYPAGLNDIKIIATDEGGLTTGLVDSQRDLKVWNCQVAVNGSLYDAANIGQVNCQTNQGYENLYSGAKFTSLDYVSGVSMAVNSPYFSGSLLWNKNYVPVFNGDLDMADPGSQQQAVDRGNLGAGTTSCGSGLSVGNNTLSAYSDNPNLEIKFAGVKNAEAWYQALGGGMRAGSLVSCGVPAVCAVNQPDCQPGMSVGTALADNGLISAVAVNNGTGCDMEVGPVCFYGIPNNWQSQTNLIVGQPGYDYFYQQYFAKLGLGTTVEGNETMSRIVADLGGTGIVFISGNLTVDIDNDLGAGKFLMVIVGGNITIDEPVTTVEGVLVANGQISASGLADSQLKINGIVYSASGKVVFNRGYNDASINNVSPGVVVNYRADLIFAMPGSLVKVISGWREGQ